MSEKLSADLNIIQSAPIELELLDGDLNIIQKLDDEPNDVGGLTSAELKAKFDESGNIIKKYINETLIPAVLAEDATEESRKQAEAARVAAEQVRQSNEAARQNAEAQRVSAENARNVWEDYSSSKAYAVGNKVASAGSSYLCIKPCTGIAPPNAEYWRLIAAKGAKGDTGAQGAQGPQGPQGAIGPEGPVGGSSNFVRYDAAQTLTDAQKTQARGNIGAAPNGYGLGNTYGGRIPNDDFNQAVANGVYFVPFTTDPAANGPSGVQTQGAALLVLAGRIDCIKHQYLFLGTAGLQGQILHRYYHNILEVWSEWEYINPPLFLGVEYRTAERYLGKPVYAQLVNLGAAPSPDTSKAINITNAIYISLEGTLDYSSYRQVLPIFAADGSLAFQIKNSGDAIVAQSLHGTTDYSSQNVHVLAKYIKSTD